MHPQEAKNPDPDGTEKAIENRRAAFLADFRRTAGDDAECLSADDILLLQSGADLDPAMLDHLSGCRMCSALRQTVQVDPARMAAFMAEVKKARPEGRAREALFDWRLPVAALTAVSAMAMVMLAPTDVSSPPVPAPVIADSRPQVEIKVTSPSEPEVVKRVPMKATQITVRDYAPQVAAAMILTESEIKLPVDTPEESIVAAKKEAGGVVTALLGANDATAPTAPGDIEALTSAYATKVLDHDDAYEVILKSKAVYWLPKSTLTKGFLMKAEVLKLTAKPSPGPKSSPELRLGDGSVITIEKVASIQ